MARKFAAVVFSLGCLQAGSVMALGLGELTIDSFLNEPLKASVSLLNTGGLHQDEIRIRLATREDFKKLGLDRAYFLTSIKFEVIADDRGGARIVMSSEEPVLEPYLDFIVEARWPSGRLLREYTVLVDPPVFSQATPVISASQRVEEVEGIPAPAKKKAGAAASSGTAVDIKKSDLAPGAMPQRDYSATTSPTPMPGSRYMINRDDTLWEIAVESKPEGASVHQTMLDIQRLNPDAFINGNINRVKAGYIVYLPNTGDISSADISAALSEVRQQNEDWRAGRDAQVAASSGPSLRISAEPVTADDTAQAPGDGEREPGDSTSTVAMEEMDKAALVSDEADERVAAMEEQVETLQRIVTVKDDQIAALQNALAAAGVTAATDVNVAPEMEAGLPSAATDQVAAEPELLSAEDESGADITEPEAGITEPELAATPAVVDTPAPAAPAKPTVAAPVKHEAATGGGLMSYIYYILGALGLAILGFIFMRRRGEDSEDESVPARAPAVDAFSNVELQDQDLAADDVAVPAQESAPVAERGYGEHKHDEYASDDAGGADALAEADIYVAYGRHSQAKDLLNNAIANEPGNPLFRLKLLEIHTELNERGAATAQFEQLQAIGDADSISRAEVLLEGMGAVAQAQEQERPVADVGHTDGGPGLSRNPLELMAESDTPLEADFSGLEIEEPGAVDPGEDELDLSADFATSELAENGENDELVIAAETNGFSTKLDLARAYLDMGDDDGARQILEEVAAEASEEVKAEANALLDRIG